MKCPACGQAEERYGIGAVRCAVCGRATDRKSLAAVTAQRDALAAKLAALEKRIAEAPKRLAYYGADYCVAVLKLTNEEASVFMEDWK